MARSLTVIATRNLKRRQKRGRRSPMLWESNWKLVFGALEPLTEADMSRTVPIRTEAHSVMQAINRQLGHYAYHVGQIVYLAKHFAGPNWKTLTVPRRKSAEFNAKVASGEVSQR